MKSTWVAAGLLLVTICQAEQDEFTALPTATTLAPDIMPLSLTKIQKMNDGDVTTYDITFETTSGNLPSDMTRCMLQVIMLNEAVTTPFQQSEDIKCECTGTSCTVKFDYFLATTLHDAVTFIVTGLTVDDDIIAEGEASWTSFPNFPTDFTGQQVKDEEGKLLLRLDGDYQDMPELTPSPVGKKVISDPLTSITYFIDITTPLTTIAPCSKSGGGSLLCDADVVVHDVDDITKSLTVKSALLSYKDNDEAPIVAITVTTTSAGYIDVLKTYNTIGLLFQSDNLKADVPIDGFTYGMEITMTIIGLDTGSNTMVDRADFSIQDINVIGYPISGTTFEVRWNYQDTVNVYKITRNLAPGDTGFKGATVACDGKSSDHCFGYFTNLVSYDYRVTVPVTDVVDKKVQSKSIPVGTTSADLNIQHVQLQGYGNALKATVCFNHTNNNAEEAFSHYDVVLIDHNGQFQKSKLITMKAAEDDHFCSRPFSVKDQDFKITEEAKVIVIKRAQDGLSVLASGEAPLL